jgi:predicted dienelactone hydrolase
VVVKINLLLLLVVLSRVLAAAATDVPELAQRGPYAVGVRTVDLVHKGQPDILHFDKATGKAPPYDRPLKIEVWYPAVLAAGQVESTIYDMPARDPKDGVLRVPGQALRDAAPLQGQKFPLVIVSHGYPGSRIFLSYLTEHLASKGYVVAAIDHTDSVIGEIRPFPSTLLNRSNDQLFTLSELVSRGDSAVSFLHGMIDSSRAAIIGYSMGGYGALASAGAGYSKTSTPMTMVPGGYLKDWTAGDPAYGSRLPKNLKAVVAIAPWGEQPPINSWDADGLSGIRVPSLFIAGDQDDVADYERGIKPAFEGLVHSDRCMLIYENARHNTGGNPPPPGLTNPAEIEFFDEPVWRKERICNINRHFVTAFLDLYLKGDESKRPYLHNLTERSNDGKWPLKQGTPAPAGYSAGDGKDGVTIWKGFQRRWALGLEMRCLAAK